MPPPKTPVTQRRAEASDDTTTPTRPSPPSVDDRQPAAPDRAVNRAVSAGIAIALIAAVAILLSGLSDDGAGPVGLRGAIPADVTAGDPAVGTEIFVEDLRSVGRIDPVSGREAYFEDLRSVGRDANAWRDVYSEDLRSIGRTDPVAGREAYFEDLRTLGRGDPDAWRDIYVEDLRSVGR